MYQLSTEEIIKLFNMELGERAKYNPMPDVNGDYFISEVEHAICKLGIVAKFEAPILKNPNYPSDMEEGDLPETDPLGY